MKNFYALSIFAILLIFNGTTRAATLDKPVAIVPPFPVMQCHFFR